MNNPILTLADQLNLLFEQCQHTSGRPYTLQEVSTGTGISLATLSQLRNGRNENPQFDTLKSLSRFFNISLDFFLSKTREAGLSCLHAAVPQPPLVTDVTLRAAALSPQAQRDLLTMITWLEAAEAHLRTQKQDLPPLEAYTHER